MFIDVATAARLEAGQVSVTFSIGEILRDRSDSTLLARIGNAVGLSTEGGSHFDKVIGLGLDTFDEGAFVSTRRR